MIQEFRDIMVAEKIGRNKFTNFFDTREEAKAYIETMKADFGDRFELLGIYQKIE